MDIYSIEFAVLSGYGTYYCRSASQWTHEHRVFVAKAFGDRTAVEIKIGNTTWSRENGNWKKK